MNPRIPTPRSGATKVAGGRRSRGVHRLAGSLLLAIAPLAPAGAAHVEDRTEYRAPRAASAPVVDGVASEPAWDAARWQPIDKLWLGPDYAASDFRGRFKVMWTPERLYLLVEIVDDILFDSHRDPLVQYWDDDCLEIFVDEDFSGGEHQFNHNAFAYHLSLDNQAIDIGTDRAARRYTDHVESRWRQDADRIAWEVSLALHSDTYVDGSADNRPVPLSAGKVIGLMLAWCDNDGSELRENFVGSQSVPSGKKDRGWIDADIFGKLVLVGEP
jgi:hypothetical protein